MRLVVMVGLAMTNRTLKVGLVQERCGGETADNLLRMLNGVRAAAQRGAELILLQELHNCWLISFQQKRHHHLSMPMN